MSQNTNAYDFDSDVWNEKLQDTLDTAQRSESPAEVHGLITGAICNHMFTGIRPSLFEILTGEKAASEASDIESIFTELYRDSSDVLFDPTLEFILLLPDESEPLEYRTKLLAEWCQGYCLGLMHNDKLVIDNLPEESPEHVRHLLEISNATTSDNADTEEDEWALAELQEYVKVAVQIIFEDIVESRKNNAKDKKVH